jgi:hypothetical protein
MASVSIQAQDWNFNTNGDFEGWTLGYHTNGGGVADGILWYDIQADATDPMVVSPTFSLARANYRWLYVRAKNNTRGNWANIFWHGNLTADFVGSYEKTYGIRAHDPEFSDYWVDLNTVPTWTSTTTLYKLRFDFPDGVDGGGVLGSDGTRIEVDRIALLPEGLGPPSPQFVYMRRYSPQVTPPDFTNAAQVVFELKFNQLYTPVAWDEVALITSPGVTIAGINTEYVKPFNYLATFDVSGEGTFRLDGTGEGTGTSDLTGLSIRHPFIGETFNIDTVPPSIAISEASASLTTGDSVTYTVNYADGDDGSGIQGISLTDDDITLNKTGTANGTPSVSGYGNFRTVTVQNITGVGTLSIRVAANTATDNAGNSTIAAGPGDSFSVDTEAPVISLLGSTEVEAECNEAYVDAGATALDNPDGDITTSIIVDNPVNTAVPDDYTVRYNVTDSAGNAAVEVTRLVKVRDKLPPEISLYGDNPLKIECGDPYVEFGATAWDKCDGDLSASISISYEGETVDTSSKGIHEVTYTVTDAAGLTASVVRSVEVVDTTPPDLDMAGNSPMTLHLGNTYVEPGITAWDHCDGDLTDDIVTVNPVNANQVGSYTITYDVTDAEGLAAAQKKRVVNVMDPSDPNVESVTVESELSVLVNYSKDMTGAVGLLDPDNYTLSGSGQGTLAANPVSVETVTANVVRLNWLRPAEMFDGGDIHIVVNPALKDQNGITILVNEGMEAGGAKGQAPEIDLPGGTSLVHECGTSYIDSGATATDDVDPSVAVQITGAELVDGYNPDDYTIIYTAVDAAGNTATLVRTVSVEDTTAPVIELIGPSSGIELECGVDSYVEEGATVTDDCEGDISSKLIIGGDIVDTSQPQSYVVTYDAVDKAGNAAETQQRIIVVKDSAVPEFSLIGSADLKVDCGLEFEAPGVIAFDLCDGDLFDAVDVDGSVNPQVPGIYTLRYNLTDSSGNTADELVRIVTVVDMSAPEITLLGENPLVLDGGAFYEEPGYTVLDRCEGDLSAALIVDADEVNDRAVGNYTVLYKVSDSADNVATATRKVSVEREACKLLYSLEVSPNPALPGESITMTAVELPGSCSVGEVQYQWQKRSGGKADWMPILTAENATIFTIESAEIEDAGDYRIAISDDMITFYSTEVSVLVDTGTPATGFLGLALAASLSALAGGLALRKRD